MVTLLCFLWSCSQQTQSVKLTVSNSFAVGDSFTGGMVVTAISSSKRLTATALSGSSITLNLESEEWKFLVVAWDGAAPMSGKAYCGTKTQTLTPNDTNLRIPMGEANCADPAFTDPGYTASSGNSFKPLRIYSCSALVDQSGSSIDQAFPIGSLLSWCDDHLNSMPVDQQTARGIKISIPGISGSLTKNCSATNEEPFDTLLGLPLNGIPVVVELYDFENCTGTTKKYDFPKGLLSGVVPGISVVNTTMAAFNGLFLHFEFANPTAAPPIATISKVSGQSNPVTTLPINYDVVFDRAIIGSTLTDIDFDNLGSALGTTFNVTPISSTRFTLTINSSGFGTILPAIKKGAVLDLLHGHESLGSKSMESLFYGAPISISPGSASLGTATVSNFTQASLFTIVNPSGIISFSGCNVGLSGVNASEFQRLDTTCDQNIYANSSCQVQIRGLPETVGVKYATVDLNCDEISLSASVSYSASSALEWNSITNDFGIVRVGKSSGVSKFHLRNNSDNSVPGCTTPSLSPTSDFSIVSHDCPTPLPARSFCTVNVKAHPGGAGGRSTTLSSTCGSESPSINLTTLGSLTNPSALSLGGHTSCMKLSDNSLSCWGLGHWGHLTNSGRSSWSSPYETSVSSNVSKVFTGTEHICIIKADDGAVNCWGQGNNGELGDGSSGSNAIQVTVPRNVTIPNITNMSLGKDYTCALNNSGNIFCWGKNSDGVFGNGTTIGSNSPVAGPTAGVPYTQISASDNSLCAVVNDGTVKCWGRNDFGQLGNGTNADSFVPVTVTGISSAVEVSSGENFHCARLTNATIKCWGQNTYGQLGNLSTTNSNEPVLVSGISDSEALSLGGSDSRHMCSLGSTNEVSCWGTNVHKETGLPTYEVAQTSPFVVSSASNAIRISKGTNHTCIVDLNNNVKCWGSNSDGQLGKGNILATVPIQIPGISAVDEVVIGEDVTCALTGGVVKCWGKNNSGQLGTGDFHDKAFPTTVINLSTVTSISGGGLRDEFTMCAEEPTSNFKCWGASGKGQTGSGNTADRITPVSITAISSAVKLGGGSSHRCATFPDGTMKCAGNNASGTLGTGLNSPSQESFYTASTAVNTAVGGVTEISGTSEATFVLKSNGSAWAFGDGSLGQLGNGNTTFNSSPTQIPGLSNVTQIQGGYLSACALWDADKVSCWGEGGSFLGIGVGAPSPALSPIRLGALDAVSEIAVGNKHVCAITTGGKVSCWGGQSRSGQIGDGGIIEAYAPKQVLGLNNVFKLWKGEGMANHSCAIKNDGTLWCWGMIDSFYPDYSTGVFGVSGYSP